MKNPIPSGARNVVYLACILMAAVVINLPEILAAIQTGDWSAAASKASATLMLVAGIIAKQNLTPDVATAEAVPVLAADTAVVMPAEVVELEDAEAEPVADATE